MSDVHDLDRFVRAQEPVLSQVLAELGAGAKRSHWMWFVFPQIAGLGYSAMAQLYAIASLDEARAYLAHPLLGPRLLHCTRLVNAVRDRTINRILGSPDDMKFHSSMTLFARADPEAAEFLSALDRWFGGVPDRNTVERLAG